MKEEIFRPYQQQALNEIRSNYAKGTKKALLHMPTGSGKTKVFCEILKAAFQKGTRAMMVVSGRMLIEQASMRLDREKVPHGIFMSNHWRRMPDQIIQVCSISTLVRRKLILDVKLIVIDECHQAASPGYHWLIEQYPDAYILGVTATPYVKRGLRHIADVLIQPITMKELVEQGYLVPARYYIPAKINLENVEVKNGEYDQVQLSETMMDSALYGDMVEAFNRYACGRPTIVFAIDVEHSKEIVERFCSEGIESVHIDANTPKVERDLVIKKLESGEIEIISSVGVLTTGVDIPCVSCIIMARPTKSYNLYIQMCGRGTRTYPGKSDFILLDHANNILEHGLIEHERDVNLDGKESKPREDQIILCEKCFSAFSAYRTGRWSLICPECGHEPIKEAEEEEEKGKNKDVDLDAELVEINSEDYLEKRIEYFIKQLVRTYINRGQTKPGWFYYRLKDEFGESIAKRYTRRAQALVLCDEARSDGLSDHPGFE